MIMVLTSSIIVLTSSIVVLTSSIIVLTRCIIFVSKCMVWEQGPAEAVGDSAPQVHARRAHPYDTLGQDMIHLHME